MPDLWQKDSNAIRYEDQEVRRSNTELTDAKDRRGIISTDLPTWYLTGWLS
jgi:hypothetical protein